MNNVENKRQIFVEAQEHIASASARLDDRRIERCLNGTSVFEIYFIEPEFIIDEVNLMDRSDLVNHD